MRVPGVVTPRPLLVGCLSVFLLAATPSGRVYQVKDINTVPGSGPDPQVSAVVVGNNLFFTVSGTLWVSDGTAAGTQPVPGMSGISAGIGVRAALGDVLYFVANDGSHGWELWRSDGTRDGTWMVCDINPGLADSRIRSLLPFRGELYFGADDGVHGFELWKSDGTRDGTVLVVDLNPGPADSALFSLRASGDRLYFSESSFGPGSPGVIYSTDGTASGTRPLRQFVSANTGCYFEHCFGWPPGGFVSLGGLTYFIASDENSGLELWRTDGTALGTTLVKDTCPGCSAFWFSDDPDSPLLQVMDGRLIFFAYDGVHGSELWTSDGTEAGTRLVKDIFPGPLDSSYGYGMTVAGGAVFFPAHSRQGDRRHPAPAWELWRSDGTEAGTFLVGSGEGDTGPNQITPVGGAVFFSAIFVEPRSVESGTRRLWKTDSADTPAAVVSDAFSDPTGLVNFDGTLYFAASGPEGLSLWKTDGTPGGTSVVRALTHRENSSSSVMPLGELDGSLLFFATDGKESWRLWRSDGTESGTQPVAPVALGTTLANGFSTPFQGSLFFNGNDGVHGWELWRTDGTPEGTRLVKDIAVIGGTVYPALQDSNPCGFNAIGDTLYFSAYDGDHATSYLWKTDGTEAGTVFLKEVSLICSWQPKLVPFKGLLYFSGAAPPVYESGLWRTDGTSQGTEQVKPVGVGDLISLGDRLLFWGSTPSFGVALWTSDGTAAGTAIMKAMIGFLTFARLKDGVLFFGGNGGARIQLWRTDGTPDGTTVLADFPAGFVGDGLNGLVAAGDRVFFAGQDAEHGIELWTSDGTSVGTHMVRDIAPGEVSSYPRNLTAVGDVLLFSARDPIHGEELWRSDGTEEGTFILDDIFPGPGSSSPANFTKAGSLVYFTADDGVTGEELWAVPMSVLESSPGRPARPLQDVPWRR